jgi:hypothetical protein
MTTVANRVRTLWVIVVCGECQVVAQLIAKRALIFPLMKDLRGRHPLLAYGHQCWRALLGRLEQLPPDRARRELPGVDVHVKPSGVGTNLSQELRVNLGATITRRPRVATLRRGQGYDDRAIDPRVSPMDVGRGRLVKTVTTLAKNYTFWPWHLLLRRV